ncbi:hypothetical protein QYF61_019226 [Mycteria americana]|uniref:Uncharacterized protein n=1 Tax=Mycteria americana TaxID=33587 RepID=A0AAN7SIR6_MYCAM|nr:hypothetical protein QYF61_019226 [Mycteria americana]
MVVTGFQLDFVPPITTLWAWLFSQFSHLTVCSNSPYSFSFSETTEGVATVVLVKGKHSPRKHYGMHFYQVLCIGIGSCVATRVRQAKQPQFPQLLLIRLLLQTLQQLHCPSLDTLQHLNVFLVVRGPKLSMVFEDCFPRDSVNQSPKQAKDCPPEVQGSSSAEPLPYFVKNQKHCYFMIAMPKTASNRHITLKSFSDHKQQVSKGTSLAHAQLGVHQDHHRAFSAKMLSTWSPSSIYRCMSLLLPTRRASYTSLVELHEAPLSPSLQPVEVPLDASMTRWYISYSSHFGVICKLAKGTLCPITRIINEDVEEDWTQH